MRTRAVAVQDGQYKSPRSRGTYEEEFSMKSRTWYVVLSLLALASPSAHPAQPTGAFPERPIRMIVPFPPGGSNDVLGRYIGTKLTERVGQQFVIDNRGGANGIIGADLAAHSTPDGYTLLVISTSWVMNAAVRTLPYDVEKSFDPIATIGSAPNSIVVNPKGPFQSVSDIVEQAKAKPGAISYASTGVGGFNHFGGELFKKVAAINLQMVPYKGGGPAMTDVMAGNIPIMFSSLTQVLPHVRGGRLKVVAVGAEKRSPVVPEIPTIAESGFPGYEVSVWWGIAAPTGLPRAVMNRLHKEITAVIQDPETQKRLLADAAVPMNRSPAEMRKLIRAGVKKWREVARVAGIKVK
jgi:tripartite-type tricarboxylate transporter receptor subunit TctC